ncbi:sensor histidine kinase [Solidesulfovibrio magneticus]|uniref:histidine kinase n=1 Tax=Solidesulfovibrio magneticus (strain ATCC 700980 / DSM 13731 / RS-1) TaxID=573370 RepID=C4XLL5_SOLM1|nr:HAMP domain-containing sensor histidine kinase [Solidesulfovibrio magneticus]BAH74603.1 putative sensor histidine kinase [Solidesulfovibrio magneticus RS-1]
MADAKDPTCFAPSERACPEDIDRQFAVLSQHAIPLVLNAMPIIAMVLNRHRQVVHGNRKFADVLGIADIREALGKRPGEAFRCVHADEHPGGCGTSEFCAHCGAVRSILLGLAGTDNVQECAINRDTGSGIEALDLRVSSASVHLDAEPYLIFSINDVSHEKRRRTLERLFFHDMLNTVGGVQGLLEFLAEEVPEELQADARLIHRAVSQLTDEIIYQKQLLAAETNELETNCTPLRSDDILDVVAATFQGGEQARDRRIVVENVCSEVVFHSDPVLLRRVVGNMVKNALEATPAGGEIRLGSRALADAVEFSVQNAGVIPRSVQMRIFSRSFSTKGVGRGLGTYSIKLLTERYLGGRADFVSNREVGTIFRVRLPLTLPADLA